MAGRVKKSCQKNLKALLLNRPISYDGTQLRSRWIERTTGLEGNALVAFRGKAQVPVENMVDLEDVAANAPIYSEEMLHFIVEFFDRDLERMVLRQRLLMAIILERLKEYPRCQNIIRKGDDLFEGKAKLSVSIATSSPRSSLIHTGLNIRSENTPVKTKGLFDYGIDPKPLAKKIIASFQKELKGIDHARLKVRPVA